MIVMPFSRSRSIESMIRSATAWFSRKSPDCQSMASTRVVLPWSTCAMMAILRIDSRCCISPSYHAVARALYRKRDVDVTDDDFLHSAHGALQRECGADRAN